MTDDYGRCLIDKPQHYFIGAPILSDPYASQFAPDSKDVDSDTAALFIPEFKNALESCLCVTLIHLVTRAQIRF